MEILTATYTQDGIEYDVEVISEFRGMAEVNGIGCYPFLHGASYGIVRSSDLKNRRVEELDAVEFDAADDAPLPVELLDARADYAQINDLQMTGRGG